MIRIKRKQEDDKGQLIQPDARWFRDAKAATDLAIKEGPKKHKVNESLYRRPTVQRALRKLFHNKCVYCEQNLGDNDFDVEHYRPKGKVKECEEHPGYYWLAYEWTNLYVACDHCNQHRKDYRTWNNSNKSPGGKHTQFPLLDEKKRQFTPKGKNQETPLLLDPCDENKHRNPEAHIYYALTGEPQPIDQSRYGEATIKICNLQRPSHQKLVAKQLTLLKILLLGRANKNGDILKEYDQTIYDYCLSDHASFAGACRAAIARPSLIGLDELAPIKLSHEA